MADNRGFFQRALGAVAPASYQPQQQPYPGPPQQPMFPAAVPVQHQVPMPGPQQYYPQQAEPEVTGEQLAAWKRSGQITFSDGVRMAMQRWSGNRKNGAAKFETYNCPECGGNNYFTRANLRDKRAGVAPAPMCMDCGYDGLHDGLIGQAVDPNLPEAN